VAPPVSRAATQDAQAWYRARMFAVLYRFKLEPGAEETFRQAWRSATKAIREHYGTSGSRLHRAGDGYLVAYAVWPDRGTWEKAQSLPSVSPESGAAMRTCLAEPVTTTPLEVVDDLLVVVAPA
jgi:quinol monooxygenase YgiN